MAVLGGGAVSDERGTPVVERDGSGHPTRDYASSHRGTSLKRNHNPPRNAKHVGPYAYICMPTVGSQGVAFS